MSSMFTGCPVLTSRSMMARRPARPAAHGQLGDSRCRAAGGAARQPLDAVPGQPAAPGTPARSVIPSSISLMRFTTFEPAGPIRTSAQLTAGHLGAVRNAAGHLRVRTTLVAGSPPPRGPSLVDGPVPNVGPGRVRSAAAAVRVIGGAVRNLTGRPSAVLQPRAGTDVIAWEIRAALAGSCAADPSSSRAGHMPYGSANSSRVNTPSCPSLTPV